MAIVDECFPRGGKAKVDKKEYGPNAKKRKSDNLFKVSGDSVFFLSQISVLLTSVVLTFFRMGVVRRKRNH